MLVLTRRQDESVVVATIDGAEELVKVTVLGMEHGKVRLGFEVSAAIPVHRWEVRQRIQGQGIANRRTKVVVLVNESHL